MFAQGYEPQLPILGDGEPRLFAWSGEFEAPGSRRRRYTMSMASPKLKKRYFSAIAA